MAHTPGPWVIREPEDDELHEVYAENGGDLICFPVYTANQKANLPLIAAAPELLDACKLAAEWLEDLTRGDVDAEAELAGIKQAIAKAEGRTDEE